MIIGLTGGIGSGKTLAAKYFRELNVPVIDSDQITRKLVEPNQPDYQAIIDHFGKGIVQKDGSLNRPKLRSLVFENPEERKWLEDLLHPKVKEEILRIKAELPKGKYAVVEIPLLIEADFQDAVDRILVIDCAEHLQIERIQRRDAVPESTLKGILKSQTDRNTRLQWAHEIILNEGTFDELRNKVKSLDDYYSRLTANKNSP